MNKAIIPVFLIVLLFSCVLPQADTDYSLDNLELGIAYPPMSKSPGRRLTKLHLDNLAVSAVRFDEHWAFRETADGVYNWPPLEERLDFCETNGYSVLLTLATHDWPAWWTAGNPDSVPPVEQFSEYVSDLLALYGDKIDKIQLGNEWNWEIEEYFFNDDDAFIAYNNALYDAVQNMDGTDKPTVVLGSISIGGLFVLAYDQGALENVYFPDQDENLFSETEQQEYAEEYPEGKQLFFEKIFRECSYDMLDLHFYDDYWNWAAYLEAVSTSVENAGKEVPPVLASEFGGPNPRIQGVNPFYQARELVSYIQTLDDLGISQAYFFKLKFTDFDLPHYNSYLLNAFGVPNPAYRVIKRFAENQG